LSESLSSYHYIISLSQGLVTLAVFATVLFLAMSQGADRLGGIVM